ncbi:MAG TPA: peptide deformylase [Polyangiaceae bacterium]|nr:peptide deformylase [Polyangiaceae bacterium]
MAIRTIARLGEPILRRTASPVAREQLSSAWFEQLVADLVDTMRHADGAGLAAPQIFESFQVCVIEVGRDGKHNPRYPLLPDIPLRVFVNPQLTPLTTSYDFLLENESISMYEGCLSVPGLRGRVTRPRSVRLRALDVKGEAIDEVWSGPVAAVIQHEVDHLHGSVFLDRVDASTLCFLQEYERYVPPEERIVDHGAPRPKEG